MWDFDKTLIPGYMQDPMFEKFGVDAESFWFEANRTYGDYNDSEINVSLEAIILNQILRYAKVGTFHGLNNQLLKQLGGEIEFYEGLPDFFKLTRDFLESKSEYRLHNISLEHYIVSTGLRQMILGSKIEPFVDGVWGCEFLDNNSGTCINEISFFLDHTTKTRAIFEINKGSNKFPIDVNATIDLKERRVPFENMIYVADGPSDVPVFSVIKHSQGRTYAVYPSGSNEDYSKAKKLLDDGRVHSFGEANYGVDSATYKWLFATLEEIADRIVDEKNSRLGRKVKSPPRHTT